MEAAATETGVEVRTESRRGVSPWLVLWLAVGFGLAGGLLDVGVILLKKDLLHVSIYYRQGRFFPWVVPLVSAATLLVPALLIVAANRLRPGFIPLRLAAWLLATLALWGPLLRTPLHGAASLVLAFGLTGWAGEAVAQRAERSPRRARLGVGVLLGVVLALAAGTSGRRALAELRNTASLPPAPAEARNVLLIVLDTVRAGSMSLHGHSRETTPNLDRWAARGVRFDGAQATASWTFPTHSSLFTGQWPHALRSHWVMELDESYPTLAGFLASHGYRTGGFAANTSFCSYESGLDRGFARYEDYPLTPRVALGTTAIGRWVLKRLLYAGDDYDIKWIDYQARDADGINRAFLDWASRPPRGADRPFFAFLNYLDAHEPFVLPAGEPTHFGTGPESRADHDFLMDYWEFDKTHLSERQRTLALDAYESCIAYLDRKVGNLLDELERRGVLENTLVVITSDHGEEFGEHGVYNHGSSLYLPGIHVPLVMIGPGVVPAGQAVADPVSLRDVPATIVDLVGIGGGDAPPFPGHSLAARWDLDLEPDAPAATTSPALSEAYIPVPLRPSRGPGPTQQGYAMSIVTDDRHYVLDSAGREELYDLASDPDEQRDLVTTSPTFISTGAFRWTLLQVLNEVAASNSAAAPGRNGSNPLEALARESLGRFRALLETLVLGRPQALGGP